MDILAADAALAEKHSKLIPDLVHMTGASSYDYQFGADRRLFDRFVEAAWLEPRTLFSHTEATLAVEGDALIGVEIGYDGPGWYKLKRALRGVSKKLLESGATTLDALRGMGERSLKASYLNPYIPDSAYYVLALAVVDTHRGRGIGAGLLKNAVEAARTAGYRELHLDVLSDNPAVSFYESMGLVCVAETVAPEPCREHGIPMEMRMVLPL